MNEDKKLCALVSAFNRSTALMPQQHQYRPNGPRYLQGGASIYLRIVHCHIGVSTEPHSRRILEAQLVLQAVGLHTDSAAW
jgi:hypothetical protein